MMVSIKSFAVLPAAIYVSAGEMVSTKATSAIAPMADMPAPILDISPDTSTSFPRTQRTCR
jgi:hypothetical protein